MTVPPPLPGHADRHHEMNFAHRSADRIVFLDEGEIIETVGPEASSRHPGAPATRSFLANHHGQVPPHHDQHETVIIS